MNRLARVALFLCAGLPAQALAAGPCVPSETTVFSCATGKDHIAVCSGGELGKPRGVLTYRFVKKGSAPFVLETRPGEVGKNPSVRAQTLMFSGGGGAVLRFIKDEYNYAVFTAIGRGWGEKSGVVVSTGGKRLSYRKCSGKPVSELGPVLFGKLGIPADDDDFDVPD